MHEIFKIRVDNNFELKVDLLYLNGFICSILLMNLCRTQIKYGFSLLQFFLYLGLLIINLFVRLLNTRFVREKKKRSISEILTVLFLICSIATTLLYKLLIFCSLRGLDDADDFAEFLVHEIIVFAFATVPMVDTRRKTLILLLLQLDYLCFWRTFDLTFRLTSAIDIASIAILLLFCLKHSCCSKSKLKKFYDWENLLESVIGQNINVGIIILGYANTNKHQSDFGNLEIYKKNSSVLKILNIEKENGDLEILKRLNSIKPDNTRGYPSTVSLLHSLLKSTDKNNNEATGRGYIPDDMMITSEAKDDTDSFELSVCLVKEGKIPTNEIKQIIVYIKSIKKEQELQTGPVKGFQVNHFSHEMLTPLNALTGLLLTAKDRIGKDNAASKLIRKAIYASERLEMAVHTQLDLLALLSGKGLPDFKSSPIKVSTLLKTSKKLIKNYCEEKGLHFMIDNQCSAECQCSTDGRRILQVLFNLLLVSVRHTTKGEIKITAAEEYRRVNGAGNNNNPESEDLMNKSFTLRNKLESKAHKIRLSIYDEGTKCNKSTQKDLTMKFIEKICELSPSCEFQSNESNFQQERFSLTFEKYNISLSKNSSMNKEFGSNFFSFNYISEMQNIPSSIFLKPIKQRPRILIVDDDPMNAFVLKLYLESFKDFDFACASNGEEAIQLVLISNSKETLDISSCFDLIIMDYDMPVMNGHEATIIIRDLERKNILEPVKIFAYTANTEKSIESACLVAGMDLFLHKPINKNGFKSILENTFGRKIF